MHTPFARSAAVKTFIAFSNKSLPITFLLFTHQLQGADSLVVSLSVRLSLDLQNQILPGELTARNSSYALSVTSNDLVFERFKSVNHDLFALHFINFVE